MLKRKSSKLKLRGPAALRPGQPKHRGSFHTALFTLFSICLTACSQLEHELDILASVVQSVAPLCAAPTRGPLIQILRVSGSVKTVFTDFFKNSHAPGEFLPSVARRQERLSNTLRKGS